ncbi:uncharacterized protein LOC131890544 [Tigriopus californicus]|uniref:uncharacterized protein LOC131890544 n=1 Tax=Tigriopus californicus TaxID=6832 RepID=UPI0027DA086E|nr:uncharacterized protein LOC131890544 [Tigriopus californicus]
MEVVIRRGCQLCLILYFIYHLALSISKLRSGELGTLITHEPSKTHEFPSITVCRHPISIDNNTSVPTMAQAYEQWEKDSLLILDRLSIGNMLKCHAAIGLETNYFETTAEEKDQIDFKVDRTFIVYRKGDLLPCETLSIRQNVTISNVIILGYTPLDEGLGSVFHIHEKDQIITVGDGFLGGDAFYGTNFKANFESTIDIKEQVFNAKPRDGASCDEQNRMKMSKCINEYISRSMTCQLPWTKRKQGSKRLCDKSTDWDDFRFVMDSLSENVTLNEVAVQTGCLPNCRYKKYDIEVVERNAQRIIWSPSNLTHTFLFQMKQAMVEVHEEKYFYDTNSFVGDVGGFLGLLLGLSVMDLVDSTLSLVYKMTSKVKTRAKAWL